MPKAWILRGLLGFCLGWATPCWAKLYLNASVYDKKGIDLGLALASELHALEEVGKGQTVVLQMKTGIKVELQAHFKEEASEGEYGPSDTIMVVGAIYDGEERVLESFLERPIAIRLGEQEVVVYNHKSQLIELKIGLEVL